MKKCQVIFISALLIALGASLYLNLILFTQAKSSYLQRQRVLLDPLGKHTFRNEQKLETNESPLLVFYGDSRAEAWPPPADLKNWHIVNRGIGGQTTAQILGRMEDDLLSLHPQRIILQAGVNDLKTLPLFPERKEAIISDCKANLHRIIMTCHEQDISVIVSTIFPVGPPSLQRKAFWSDEVAIAIAEVNQFLRDHSFENIVILDAHQILLGKNRLINPRYNQDTLHLNKHGYQLLNEALIEFIQ